MPLEFKVNITYLHQDKKAQESVDWKKNLVNTQRLQFIVQSNKKLAVQWRIKDIKTEGNLGRDLKPY